MSEKYTELEAPGCFIVALVVGLGVAAVLFAIAYRVAVW